MSHFAMRFPIVARGAIFGVFSAIFARRGNLPFLPAILATLPLLIAWPLKTAAAPKTPGSTLVSLDRASQLIETGHYQDAEALLKPLAPRPNHSAGHLMPEAADAGYLLALVYRAEGRYDAALAEIDALLESALPVAPDISSAHAFLTRSPLRRSELVSLQVALLAQVQQQQELQSRIASITDPVRRHLAQGDLERGLDGPGDHPARSFAAYTAALKALTPAVPASERLQVENKYLNALLQQPLTPGMRQTALDTLLILLEDPTASTKERQLAQIARQVSQRSLLASITGAMADGVAAEQARRWADAARAYRTVATFAAKGTDGVTSPSPLRPWLPAYVQEAGRSVPLMEDLAAQTDSSQSRSGCAYLGVDHAASSDWSGTLGKEGWVLFASHGGDLCGGPHILDSSFSYHAYLGDAQNQVRRWRDLPGPVRFPGSDLPLSDPASPSEDVISYLDDNGEEYPVGAGPDLYVDLTIPPGHHLLSVPLHFDLKAPEACYGLYLLAPSTAPSGTAPYCLAAGIVSTHDEPGMARIAVAGPARYTLLMRRLSSENANLPALLLDPDLASAASLPLSDVFIAAELTAAGLAPENGSAKTSSLAAAQLLVLQNMVHQYEHGHLAPEGWADLAARATQLSNFSGLDAGQQAVAAWVAWQAQERDPLHTATDDRFMHYLNRRYALPVEADATKTMLQAQQAILRKLGQEMRETGQVRLAEIADDAASERQRQLVAKDATAASVVNTLWNMGPSSYLTRRTVWLWQGEDGSAPHRMTLALDVNYASQKARLLVRYLLTSNSEVLKANHVELRAQGGSLSFDDPAAQRVRLWLDRWAHELNLSLGGANASFWEPSHATASATTISASGKDSELPVAAILYTAACEALQDAQNAPKNISAQATEAAGDLLRPDQMELLARCYLNRDMFVTSRQNMDWQIAARLLQNLNLRYPEYARQKQVEALLTSLQSTVSQFN